MMPEAQPGEAAFREVNHRLHAQFLDHMNSLHLVGDRLEFKPDLDAPDLGDTQTEVDLS